MSSAFVTLSSDQLRQLQGRTLITPNERLAREYRKALQTFTGFSDTETQPIDQAWRHSGMFSLGQYFRWEYQRYLEQNPSALRLVPEYVSINLAYRSLNNERTTQLPDYLDTWQLCRAYDIPRSKLRDPAGAWQKWQRKYDQGLIEAGYITAGDIPNILLEDRWLPHFPLVVTELDQLTRAEERYFDMLASAAMVETLDYPTPSKSACQLLSCASLHEELRQAAQWAQQTKRKDAESKIGIVIPDLTSRRDLVANQIGQILDPATGSLSATFDITGGTPLTTQHVWTVANRVLQSCVEAQPIRDFRTLLQSPFLDLQTTTPVQPPKGLGERATLDQYLAEALDLDLLAILSSAEQRAPSSVWLDLSLNLLRALGWPNLSDLTSTQFQAYEQIQQMLSQISTNGDEQPVNFQRFLTVTNHFLSTATFAPQRAAADILCLGQLESTGLAFTHLWLCGLDEFAFPGTPKRNPFIPTALAEAHGVPRSTTQLELAFSERQLERWQQQTRELVFSYTNTIDGAEVRPSPLLPACMEREHLPPPSAVEQAALEHYTDDQGAQMTEQPQRGGSGLLQAQYDCPFRAYATYRLNLQPEEEPSDLPDARLRGIVIHEALHALFSRHRTQAASNDISASDLTLATDVGMRELPNTLPKLFVQHERERIQALLKSWLDIEQQRPAFNVVGLEQRFDFSFSGLDLTIRLDRIDEIDGALLVIDYKTGRLPTRSDLGPIANNLQLPLYVMVDERVRGAAFAQVKDTPAIAGVQAENENLLAGRRVFAIDWPAHTTAWRSQIESLAADFADGLAHVSPRPGACRYCDFQRLCRIGDKSE